MIPKYRAFWKSEKKMITNISWIRFDKEDLIGKIEGQTILPIGFSEVILMQSTGLKDKNDIEIFEGDIVKTTRFVGRADEVGGFYEYDKEITGVVKMLEGCWVIDTGNNAVDLWSEIDENEVLGNIHEKPDLMEAENEQAY
uniref:YopX family protein n=1 Tax=Streptococcus pluranimalium TaxID=82348 RepID=UPI003F68DAF6